VAGKFLKRPARASCAAILNWRQKIPDRSLIYYLLGPANRRSQFHKRRQPFIRTHDEVFSIGAVRAVYLAEKTMTSFERLLF
jgi:hypothetical protein